jgi:hypothetical protein
MAFRCDMAEMVPVEFWNWAIPQVKAVNPEIIFVAEIYNPVSIQKLSANRASLITSMTRFNYMIRFAD